MFLTLLVAAYPFFSVSAASTSGAASFSGAASAPAQPPKKPDIYYIVFDEYAGFDSISNYWHDSYADAFQSFLKENHFFVATASRSRTLNTAAEIASRLNLQPYPENLPGPEKTYGIDNNQVMQALKANGYTNVAIDMFFQNINADITIQYDPESIEAAASSPTQKTFLDTTMREAFRRYAQSNNPDGVRQRELILYSLEKTVHPGNINAPKFVYTHILLPHVPFIFDQFGNLLPAEAHDNWDYYLGQHKYATQLAERLVAKLLEQANPKNPPVIILQSDHGARNIATIGKGGKVLNKLLNNYSITRAHDILNALYLPGFDTRSLPNDIDPIETFAVVLNHYLDLGLEVTYTPVVNPQNPFYWSAASPD